MYFHEPKASEKTIEIEIFWNITLVCNNIFTAVVLLGLVIQIS